MVAFFAALFTEITLPTNGKRFAVALFDVFAAGGWQAEKNIAIGIINKAFRIYE